MKVSHHPRSLPRSSQAGTQLRKLAIGSIHGIGFRAIGLVCLTLMHLVLANNLGPHGYGAFSYAVSFVSVAALIVSWGWPHLITRLIVQYTEGKEWALLRGAIVRSHQITILSAVGFGALLLAVASFAFVPEHLRMPLRYSAILLPVYAALMLRRRSFQGFFRVRSAIFFDEIALPLLVAMSAIALSVGSPQAALLLYLIAAVVLLVVGTVWLWRCMPENVRATAPSYTTGQWSMMALPMALGGLSQVLFNRTDVLMLGTMVGMSVTGVYSASERLALLTTFVMTGVNVVGAPALARAYFGRNEAAFRAVFQRTMLWSVLGAIPVAAVLVALPHYALSAFGDEFAQGTHLLRILVIGQFLNACSGLAGTALMMTGQERVFAKLTGASAVLHVLINLIAIPKWGAVGAAWSTAACMAGLNVSMALLVRQNNRARIGVAG